MSNNHRIVAHKTKTGVVVSDDNHDNYYTGSRYGWSVLLKGRKDMPDDHERDIARQSVSRDSIPFSDSKNARILRRGYVQS